MAPRGRPGRVPWGRGRGTTAREARMAVAWTDGGGSGGAANNSGGNGAALSAVPSLTCATRSWRRGRCWCLGIVGHPILIDVMLSQRWGGLQCLVIVGIPLLTGAMMRRCRGGQRCLCIIGHSLACSCDGGGGGRTKVPWHCCAMAVTARPTIVPLNSRPSLACSWMARMEAARTDGGGSGGGASNGGGNGLTL